jgi:hypothetical protein
MRELRKPERRHRLGGSHWSADRKAKATKSRIANGVDVLPDIDGRSSTARRYKDVCGAVLRDLGGIDACSQTTIEIARRFAAIAVLAEGLEAKIVRGESVNSAEFCLLASTLVRLATKVGLRRIPRSVQTPSLSEYLDMGAERDENPDEASE